MGNFKIISAPEDSTPFELRERLLEIHKGDPITEMEIEKLEQDPDEFFVM